MNKLHNLFKEISLRTFLTLSILLICATSFGSHIVGADLFYTHVSGNTYKITFVAYGDCGPASAGSFATLPSGRPLICIYDGATSVSNISLTIDTPANPLNGHEITPVCPSDSANTQCTNSSYTIPGIKKFVYTGTYTVPYASHLWRFLFTGSMGGASGAGRAAAITNITTGTVIQLVDTLDNYYHANSSPLLTIVPTPFFCLNNSDSYNPGAVDADGDSLGFYLVRGMNGSSNCSTPGTPVTYTGGTSATAPLIVSAGTFSFNSTTGQLNFFPNTTQRALVVYNVREYRNDTFIGTSQREMTFLVLTCSNPPPTGGITGGSGGTVVDSTHFKVCTGTGSFSIVINGYESDTSKYIKVSATGLPTGSTFTITNDSTNHPTGTFAWTTTGVSPGTYTFFVTFRDNNCPINGVRTNAYTITIAPLPTIDAGANTAICLGASLVLNPTGGVSYVWSPGSSLSCTACTSPIATPSATTLYTVTGTDANGCVNTDTVRITVNPVPGAIAGTTTVCVGSTTTLSNSVSGGTWSVSSGIATISASGVVTGVTAGTATVTYTLPAGCYTTVTITVNPLPAAIGGPTTVCVNASITLTDATGSGTWSSSNNAIATIAPTTGVLTGVGAGTATISYTLSTGCLTTYTVTVNPIPAAIAGPTAVCVSSTITLTNSVSGGTWTSSATGTATVGSTTGIVTGVSAGSVTITYTLSGGCYVTYNVTVNPRPGVIGGPTGVCVGFTITLTNATAGGTWTSGNTSIATIDASTGVLYGVSPGTVNITYTLGTGCYNVTAIEVNQQPAAIGGPSVVCVGSTITLTNSVSGGNWTSTTTGIATIISTSGVLTGVSAGTAAITYTMPVSGCFVATSVTVNPLPNAGAISGSTTVCVGATITLTESVTGGTWSNSFTSISTVSSTGVVTGVSAGVDTIKYSITNSCGTAIARYVITVIAQPNAGTISGPTSVCVNDIITLSNTITVGTWSSGSTGTATISAAGVVYGVAAGTVTISYSFTNACGTAVTTATITVKPLPTITISPATVDFCIGGNASLTASGGVTYTWSPSTALTSTVGATVIASPTITTTYMVTGVGANGCSNSTTRIVTVHDLPIISITTPVTICYGYSATLAASGAVNYTWGPATSLSSTVGAVVVATPADTINYTVTGTDAFGCVNTAIVVVNVNPIPATPSVTTPVTYCMSASSVPLVASGVNLLWYTSSTGGTGTATAPTPSTAAVGTTTWYVTQTIDGCESPRNSITVIVMEDAITDFSFTVKYGCTRDTVIFNNLSQFCYKYEWYFGDATVLADTSMNPVHYYPPAHEVNSNYVVKLHGYNSICFDDSTTKIVSLAPNANPLFKLINVTPDQSIMYGSSVQLNAWGAVVYYWTPNDGSLSNPNINNPVATPKDSTTYTVYGYNNDGCLDSALVHINVNYDDTDLISSGFTPNGDGLNDIFRISHLRHGRLVDFSIYNRWGELIFQTADVTKGWDGTYKSVPQDMETYNYMIITAHSDGSNKYYKGSVTLIR